MGIEIVEKTVGHVVEIEENIPMWKMPTVMGRDFTRIFDYIAASTGECAGAPYARYVGVNWQAELSKNRLRMLLEIFTRKWRFFSGIPVAVPLKGEGRITANEIPPGKFLRAVHRGPYHRVPETYRAMIAWARKENVRVGNSSFEFYTNDPRGTPKQDLETIVLIPVSG